MSGFNRGMRTSATDEWCTPADLFAELDSEFRFTLDVASTDENALCERHYTKREDGLAQPWDGSVWCNPPYGGEIGKWMKKAAQTDRGGVVVCLVPARTDTRWWHEYVAGRASEVRFIKGRLRFSGSGSAPFPSAVVIYDKRRSRWWSVGGRC